MSEPRPLVIVVDDALALRLVLVRALTEAGFDALSAPDGSAAATLILGLRQEPDVVVTDIRMPVMDGRAVRIVAGAPVSAGPDRLHFRIRRGRSFAAWPPPHQAIPPGALCSLVRQAIAAQQGSVLT